MSNLSDEHCGRQRRTETWTQHRGRQYEHSGTVATSVCTNALPYHMATATRFAAIDVPAFPQPLQPAGPVMESHLPPRLPPPRPQIVREYCSDWLSREFAAGVSSSQKVRRNIVGASTAAVPPTPRTSARLLFGPSFAGFCGGRRNLEFCRCSTTTPARRACHGIEFAVPLPPPPNCT